MSAEHQARELETKQRQHGKHQHESMLNRAEAEIKQLQNATSNTEEQARELEIKQRQHDKHQHESMLNRAESEIGVKRDAANAS